jgi:uncharacterized protein (DUF362 family)
MNTVAFTITLPCYNEEPPFHPDQRYPESPFEEISGSPNFPYQSLRDLLRQLGYDISHFGTSKWNPFGEFIRPGQTVLIKPNFVLSFNRSGNNLFCVITHPSILRAVVDYSYIALKGKGRIIIADDPQMDCSWNELMEKTRLIEIQKFYSQKFSFKVDIVDLRNFEVIDPKKPAYSENRKALAGDPIGNVIVNLAENSEFFGLPSNNYYGADYDRTETIRHHQGNVHEYCISKTVLSADVFISVPKMKVHKKVGVTLNLKGLVGINSNKNFLIHYRLGSPKNGGDQLPDSIGGNDRTIIRIQRWLFDKALAKQTRLGDQVYRAALGAYRHFIKPFKKISETTSISDEGNWHGNDSAWRMTADLAKILFYADQNGKLTDSIQRKIFCIVDGIVGGENNGPLAPDEKPCGCLIAGENPFSVDLVTTRLMGFDIDKVHQFDIIKNKKWDFQVRSASEVSVIFNGNIVDRNSFWEKQKSNKFFNFKPHPGWTGHIEI